jgi:hypothetical protein
MFNPEWIEAAADAAAVVEKGVAMRSRKQAEAAATPPAALPPPTVVVNSITGAEYLFGMFVLALAMLGAAVIIHHGLTA